MIMSKNFSNAAVTFPRLNISRAAVRFKHEKVNCECSDWGAGSRLGHG